MVAPSLGVLLGQPSAFALLLTQPAIRPASTVMDALAPPLARTLLRP
jgi:hypothetical protein